VGYFGEDCGDPFSNEVTIVTIVKGEDTREVKYPDLRRPGLDSGAKWGRVVEHSGDVRRHERRVPAISLR